MKEWFENWKISENENGKLEIVLPNSKNGMKHCVVEVYKTISKTNYDTLFSILIAAFDQIQKDHGGYKNNG